jgi:predicted GIY-YIG superfamily endonuclease
VSRRLRAARAYQHRNGAGQHYGDVREAIAREKQLKKWERRWKLDLIERFNPDWTDLYETLNA